MKVFLTVDVEQDCPPFLSGYRGIEEGLPRLLALFQRQQIPATFFTTGEIARKYPDAVRGIVAAGHELGCHGDTHRRFDQMDYAEAQQEILQSTETLRAFAPVLSFRAPNLAFPEAYLPLLKASAYQLDSSQAKYKRGYYKSRLQDDSASDFKRVPASATSSVLRLPDLLRRFYLNRLSSPIVLFVHPWEFVDLRKEKLRWDCRFKTGDTALNCLSEVMDFFRAKQASFQRMDKLIARAVEN